MIVVVAESIPPAVRGRMKLWFVEPRPNVFVSGVKDSVAREVVSYLYDSCPFSSNMTILESINRAPYYRILRKGCLNNHMGSISGLPLIFDKLNEG